MAEYRDFVCTFIIPRIELTDVESIRSAIIEAVNEEEFKTFLDNFKVVADNTKKGPAPRLAGGEITITGSASSSGEVKVTAGVKISW